MKKLIFILSIVISHSLSAQITLKECIERGLANKATIKSAKSELLISNLKSIESKSKYLPQISLAYDYRYNPIIATQIVPVGQFSPIPTDETRAIQFGTNWQQNAGITLYQPIIDFTVQSRIKESKLNESLSTIDLKKAEADLAFEISKVYSQIITLGYRVDEAITDTVRSFQSYSIVKARFLEGKILKTELNNALVNHNTNVTNFKKNLAQFINEKIYLHFLTNIELEKILEEKFSPIPASFFANSSEKNAVQLDSIPDFQRLKTREQLINQQIKTERTKYSPTIGFQGFLGANQFSQTFNPVLANSWFGNSYVGLSFRLPIFSPDKAINGGKQLQKQLQIVNNQKEELKAEKNKDLLQKNIEIGSIQAEISQTENSVLLQSENVKLYQERLQNGQFAAIELNVQETELQKLSNQLKQLKEQLHKAYIERLYLSGNLWQQIKSL
jgi:outer membrane protein TolC